MVVFRWGSSNFWMSLKKLRRDIENPRKTSRPETWAICSESRHTNFQVRSPTLWSTYQVQAKKQSKWCFKRFFMGSSYTIDIAPFAVASKPPPYNVSAGKVVMWRDSWRTRITFLPPFFFALTQPWIRLQVVQVALGTLHVRGDLKLKRIGVFCAEFSCSWLICWFV